MEAIEIKNITKEFKNLTALSNVSLEIHEGECFALLGPNGAGKTTLIKILSSLLSPTSGTALILGNDILQKENEVKKVIAVCPQETAIAKNLTALENLEMIAAICGKTKKDAKELAERFKLLKNPKQLSKNLSGGNKRRLSIAMALLPEPKVLFLDEPTLGLDIEARIELWDLIKSLRGKTTIVLTTHYLEEADKLSNRIGVIKGGKIIELDTPENLKKKYAKEGETNPSIDDIYIRIIKGEKNEI